MKQIPTEEDHLMSKPKLTVCLDTSTFINLEKPENRHNFEKLCEWKSRDLIRFPMDVYSVLYELLREPHNSSEFRFRILDELCGLDTIAINSADEELPAPGHFECVKSEGFLNAISSKEYYNKIHQFPIQFRNEVKNTGISLRKFDNKSELIERVKTLYYLMMKKNNINYLELLHFDDRKKSLLLNDNIAEFLIRWMKNVEFMNSSGELDLKFIKEYHKCLSNYSNTASFMIVTGNDDIIDYSLDKKHKIFVEDFYVRMKDISKEYGSVQVALKGSDPEFMKKNHGRELFQWIYLEQLLERYEIGKDIYIKRNEPLPDFPDWIYKGLNCKDSVWPKSGMPEPNDVFDLLRLSCLSDVDLITVDSAFFKMLENTKIEKSTLKSKWIISHKINDLVNEISNII